MTPWNRDATDQDYLAAARESIRCDPPGMHMWLNGQTTCQCGASYANPVPTPEHIARVKRLWKDYAQGDIDPLTVQALVWQIPGLLLRIDFLEAMVKNIWRSSPGKFSPDIELRTCAPDFPDVRYWLRGPRWTDNGPGEKSNPAKVQFCGAGRGRINGIFQCYQAGELSCYEP